MPTKTPEPIAADQRLHERVRSLLGSLALAAGIAILVLRLVDFEAGWQIAMPRSWYTDRAAWVAAGLAGLALGWSLLRDSSNLDASDRGREQSTATRTDDGPYFDRVVLYTRKGCHLCELAHETLDRYADRLPQPVEVDIDEDPRLAARYNHCVPVVEFDGRVRFRGRVNEILLRRLIEAAVRERMSIGPRDTTPKLGNV